MLLIAACTSPTPTTLIPTENAATATVLAITAIPTSTIEPEQIVQESPVAVDTQAAETPPAECPGEQQNLIGQGIAGEYEFTSYAEVMNWFCDGAEFEDILVALQTEDQTEFPAEEMLILLSEGFNWEDIWLVIGLIE